MVMLPPGGPRGMPPPRGPAAIAGGVPPMGMTPNPALIQGIMRMLPPQVVQQLAADPTIIPRLIKQFMPMVLGAMGGGGGGMPPGGMPPGLPPRGLPPRGLPPRRPPGLGPPPGAFSGNAPPQPPSQGAIQPQSTEEELAEAQQNMGKKPRGAY